MIKTVDEWIEHYCKETNDIFTIPKGYQLVSHPSRGICVYSLYENIVTVYEACGDCNYWKHFIETAFIYTGIANVFGTICSRDIKPYMRLIGCEFVDGDIESRFLARDKDLGHAVLFSVRGTNKNGDKEYIVTEFYSVQCPSTLEEFLKREETLNVETK